MKVSVHENIVLSHKEITEETFQMYALFVNSFLKILIVRTHKSIAEVPGVLLKCGIIDVESVRQIALCVVIC